MNAIRLKANLDEVRAKARAAALRAGRAPDSVTLVAVTKRHPVEVALALLELGQLDLAENYPQELVSKVEAVGASPARWHLIGHLQGNKVKRTVPLVRLVHAVDSIKLLRALDELAPTLETPPAVCLQVNTSAEASKHGWSAAGILEEAEAIAGCARVPIVGLMTIAGYGTTPETARPCFTALRGVRDALAARTGLALPQLSMGMSSDYEAAIAEGATFVRVGSALFEGALS